MTRRARGGCNGSTGPKQSLAQDSGLKTGRQKSTEVHLYCKLRVEHRSVAVRWARDLGLL